MTNTHTWDVSPGRTRLPLDVLSSIQTVSKDWSIVLKIIKKEEEVLKRLTEAHKIGFRHAHIKVKMKKIASQASIRLT